MTTNADAGARLGCATCGRVEGHFIHDEEFERGGHDFIAPAPVAEEHPCTDSCRHAPGEHAFPMPPADGGADKQPTVEKDPGEWDHDDLRAAMVELMAEETPPREKGDCAVRVLLYDAALRARVAELEEFERDNLRIRGEIADMLRANTARRALENAPHGDGCGMSHAVGGFSCPIPPCDCWKAAALKEVEE